MLNNPENYWGQSLYDERVTLQMPEGKFSFVRLIKQGVGTLVLHEAGSGQTDYWQWADGTIQLDTTGDFKYQYTIAKSLQYFDEIQAWDPTIPQFRENSDKKSFSYSEIRAEFMQMFGYKDLMPSDLFEGLKDEFRSHLQEKITKLPYAQYEAQIQNLDSSLMRELQLLYNAYAYAADRYIQKKVQDFLQFLGPTLRLDIRGIEYLFQAVGQQDLIPESTAGNLNCWQTACLQLIHYGLVLENQFGNQWAEELYYENMVLFNEYRNLDEFKNDLKTNPNIVMELISIALETNSFNEDFIFPMTDMNKNPENIFEIYGDKWLINIDIAKDPNDIGIDFNGLTFNTKSVSSNLNPILEQGSFILAEFKNLRSGDITINEDDDGELNIEDFKEDRHWCTIIKKFSFFDQNNNEINFYLISDSDAPINNNQGQFILISEDHLEHSFIHGVQI